MRNLCLVILLGFLASGCAFGNTHRYDLGDAAFNLQSDKAVAVATLDLRSYVRSGDKPPSFVGLQRGGFGNPFDINTSSGRPMAEDMTTSIVKALTTSGVQASGVNAPTGAGEAGVRELLLKAEAERFVLFLVREWKADTYLNTALIYDVTLSVLQGDGSQVAEKSLQGRDNLGSSLVPADARVNTEKAFRRKLEEAINDPAVAAALQ